MKQDATRWNPFDVLQKKYATWRDTPRPRFSLKWRMIHLILICWVLPVVLLVGFGGFLLHQSLTRQSIERLTLSVESANQLTNMRMEAAVSASRATSYQGIVREAWTQYLVDGDKIAMYETTRAFLAQQYDSDEKFYTTILLFNNFVSDPIYVVNDVTAGRENVRNDADKIFAIATEMSKELDTGIGFFAVGQRVFIMRNLVDKNYNTFAVLMMELNTGLLFTEFSQVANTQIGAVTINDVVIALQAENPPDANLPPLEQEDLGIDLFGREGMVVSYENQAMHTWLRARHSDYTIGYYAISYPSILHEQWSMTVGMLCAVFLLMIPLGALILQFFMQHVTKPIQAIITLAEKISREKYGVQLPGYALESEEFGMLGENFNQMSLTLQNQFEHIYKEELALRDARIMALQSQINPHFLNNTLEIINWEARMQGDLKVCNMLESLSTMLNAAMDRRNRPMVHLSEELMYVDAYLYIINERLGKRLVFEKDIPDDLLDCQVPRLILQPILENAVNHGITPVQQGRIALRAKLEGEWLILSVENDGQLSQNDQARIALVLSDDYTPESLSSGSLGLRNIHQRLRILYGEESGVLVDVTKKDTTAFQLKVKNSQR